MFEHLELHKNFAGFHHLWGNWLSCRETRFCTEFWISNWWKNCNCLTVISPSSLSPSLCLPSRSSKFLMYRDPLLSFFQSMQTLTSLVSIKSWSSTLFINHSFATSIYILIGFQPRLVQMIAFSDEYGTTRIDFPSFVCTTSNCCITPAVVGTTPAWQHCTKVPMMMKCCWSRSCWCTRSQLQKN